MRNLILALFIVLAGCATTGSGPATEVEPGSGPYALGDSLIALQMDNQNFEDALVLINLPEGRTVRLGWIPGHRSKAWTVPIEYSGFVTFEIQLMAAEHQVGLQRNDRTVVRCRSQMYFSPGVSRRLIIPEPVGGANFCPGSPIGSD